MHYKHLIGLWELGKHGIVSFPNGERVRVLIFTLNFTCFCWFWPQIHVCCSLLLYAIVSDNMNCFFHWYFNMTLWNFQVFKKIQWLLLSFVFSYFLLQKFYDHSLYPLVMHRMKHLGRVNQCFWNFEQSLGNVSFSCIKAWNTYF